MVAAVSTLDQLSEEQQEQVAVIVERCMVAMESGQQVDIDTCISEHPELQESLRKCLTSLQQLHTAVGDVPSKNKFVNTPAQGSHLGDFLLHREIGRGGMGIVYSATQVSLNRTVALKVLPESLWLDPKRVRRFQLEAQAAALLQHPNIIPIYAIGTEGNVRFYAMPLIDGSSLDQVPKNIWQENGFRQLLEMSIAAGNALQHAHDLGVIHRDVKPSNLILDRYGKIWITDFGLAQQIHNHNLTVSGELVGTLSYMSPEQASGEPIDHRTDVYGFAATLYELCTGEKVIPNASVAETFHRIREVDPILPRSINANVPEDLETVLLKGLAKDRNERYASIAEMVHDLIAIRESQPILGRRPSRWNLVLRWLKRNRLTALVGGVLGSLTMIAALVAVVILFVKQREVQVALQTSEQNLKTANENYWLGRDLLDKWNAEIIPLLADDSADPQLRQEMLADSIKFYQHFLAKENHHQDHELDIATQITRVQLAEAYASSNEWQQAIAQLELVVTADSPLATTSPTEMRWYAKAVANLGLGHLQLRETNEAIKRLTQAVALYDKLATENLADSTRPTLSLEHAAVLTNLSQAYRSQGKHELSLQQLQQATLLCEQVPNAANYSKAQRLLTQIWDHEAALLADSNPKQALDCSQKSVALQTQHIEFIRTNGKRIRQYATSLHNLAILQQKQGDVQAALVTLQKTVEQRQTAILLQPTSPKLRSELSVTLNAQGLLLADSGDMAHAKICFEQAADQLQQARDMSLASWNAESQVALLNVLINLASVSKDLSSSPWSELVHNFENEWQHAVLQAPKAQAVEQELVSIRQRAEQLKLGTSNSSQAEQ